MQGANGRGGEVRNPTDARDRRTYMMRTHVRWLSLATAAALGGCVAEPAAPPIRRDVAASRSTPARPGAVEPIRLGRAPGRRAARARARSVRVRHDPGGAPRSENLAATSPAGRPARAAAACDWAPGAADRDHHQPRAAGGAYRGPLRRRGSRARARRGRRAVRYKVEAISDDGVSLVDAAAEEHVRLPLRSISRARRPAPTSRQGSPRARCVPLA